MICGIVQRVQLDPFLIQRSQGLLLIIRSIGLKKQHRHWPASNNFNFVTLVEFVADLCPAGEMLKVEPRICSEQFQERNIHR